MTPDELEAVVKSQGWRLEWSKRYRTRYAYAARGSKPHVKKRYLCGEHGLDRVEAKEIIGKLQNQL